MPKHSELKADQQQSLLMILLLTKYQKKRRRHRFWVHPILKECERQGAQQKTRVDLTSWTNRSTTALSWRTSILPKSGRKWAPRAFCLAQGHSFYGWCTADTDQNHYISTCIETSFVLVSVSVSGQCCFMVMDSESKIFGAAVFVVSWFWCLVYWFPALLALIWPVQSAGC